jgi:chorismate mutase
MRLADVEIDPVALGSQGTAVLGIRDSGKTYTATWLAEQLFDAGIPFIAFDPIGVWRYLRVPGKGKGYPIVVAGGEEGDLPLSPATAPMIVEAAMQNGVSLVIDLFHMGLSKADWRAIVRDCVRLLLHKNKQYGLRHVFLEEAAEFAPQKILDGLVYAEIEKLARMGGNARLGYTLINQRAQEVNKAVLELCDNLFLHRQKGKNALDSLKKWLEIAGASGSEAIGTLPTLPQGECWAWLSSSDMPFLWKVPQKNSQHPDRRIMHGDVGVVTKKAVKVDKFVLALQKTLPQLEEQMKSNDPKSLQQQIAKLTRDLAAAQRTGAPAWPDQREEVAQFRKLAGQEQHRANELQKRMEAIAKIAGEGPGVHIAEVKIEGFRGEALRIDKPTSIRGDGAGRPIVADTDRLPGMPSPTSNECELTNARRSILDKIAWAAEFFNQPAVDRQVLAFLLGKHPRTKSVLNDLGALRTGGYVEYLTGGVALTEFGRSTAADPGVPTGAALIEGVKSVLSKRQGDILDLVLSAGEIDRQALADRFDIHVRTKSFLNDLGRMKSLGLIYYGPNQTVGAADFVRSAAA